ncbi:MAG: UvrD-helicase domain-containing protein [Bacillota bacterium]|nr:UvrD-helicase domain-containing protein [Bacillota bacterium]
MDILDGLNQQQSAAVTAEDEHILVIAGAGSGKTRVLVSRLAWLMTEKQVSPYNIMAVTFTNKAAEEMKERVEAVTGCDTRRMWIGTFHALCARLLRYEGDRHPFGGNFIIYDDGDSRNIIKRILKELELSDEDEPPAALHNAISEAKNKLIRPEDYAASASDEQRTAALVYRRYQDYLRHNRALDFDDLLTHCVWLLEDNEDIRQKYAARFQHILVDEFQDTNACQYRLIRLLGEPGGVFAVGDPDQSIYRWRGAEIGNIIDFAEDFAPCRELTLTENYRSTQNILDAANGVISANRRRKPKELFTAAGAGEKLLFYQAEDDKREAYFAISSLNRLIGDGYDWRDCAILYRTHGQSRLFEDECNRYNIPYRVFGGMKFYERKEVKDTIAYLRLAANPDDGEALNRIYNEPRRGLGAATWQQLQQLAASSGRSVYSLLADADSLEGFKSAARNNLHKLSALLAGIIDYAQNNASVARLIKEIWLQSGYYQQVAALPDGAERVEILEQLYDSASSFDELYGEGMAIEGDDQPFDSPLAAYLAQHALSTDADLADSGDNYLSLMTLHAAKGLEFPVVFIVGLEEGIFPHKRAIFSFDDEQMEEERRLCYVGMTRAKHKLCLTAARRRQFWGAYQNNLPSRFLREIPPQLLDVSGNIRDLHQPVIDKSTSTLNLYTQQPQHKPPQPPAPVKERELFALGDKVRHSSFGDGVIVAISGGGDELQLTVAFPDVGVKKLMWKYAPVKKI